MKDSVYLKQMIDIVVDLDHIASEDPPDMAAWYDRMQDMHLISKVWYRSRRRRSWFMIVFCCVLICLAAWIALTIFW